MKLRDVFIFPLLLVVGIAMIAVDSSIRSYLWKLNGLGLWLAPLSTAILCIALLYAYLRLVRTSPNVGNSLIIVPVGATSLVLIISVILMNERASILQEISVRKFLVAASPAFIEETVFRGVYLDYLAKRLGSLWGVGIVSGLFSFLHLLNILVGQTVMVPFLINAFFVGILLSVIYLRFGLLSAIVLHLLSNAIVPDIIIESSYLSSIPIILFAALGSYLLFKKERLASHNRRSPDDRGSQAL